MIKRREDILYIVISAFVLVAAWIGFNIFHTFATSTINEDTQIQILPIDPNFDMATLDKLKARKKVDPHLDSASASALENTNNEAPVLIPTATSIPVNQTSGPTVPPVRSLYQGNPSPT